MTEIELIPNIVYGDLILDIELDSLIDWLDSEGFQGIAEATREYTQQLRDGTADESPAKWITYCHRDLHAARTYHNDHDDPPEYFDAVSRELGRLERLLTKLMRSVANKRGA